MENGRIIYSGLNLFNDSPSYDIGEFMDLAKRDCRVEPPSNIDSRYFTETGNANKRLIEIKDDILLTFQGHSRSKEKVLGIYVVGSSASGDFHANSDLDINVRSNVSYTRGKDISSKITDDINPALANWEKIFVENGIDTANPDKKDLISRGLLKEGECNSVILILDRLGKVPKRDMIDVTFGAPEPWGRVYDLQKGEWVKFREGSKKAEGPISQYFQYGL